MTPEGFRQWLKLNSESLRAVEDVICCLPQTYLKNYLVSYADRAGQAGTPDSPRVFMFDSQKAGTMILTFNGGDAYLNDPLNIQMGYLKEGKKFEVYDIEFYKRFAQMSEKNPVRCLRCHSDVKADEARPFFHMNGSFGFVTGPGVCSKEEDELQAKAQAMALTAIVKNPRFACLDRVQAQATLAAEQKNHKWTNGNFDENLRKIKAVLSKYEKLRLAQLIRSSPDYNKYRFALLGAERCPNFKVSDWLPHDELTKHNNFASLNSELADVQNQDQYKESLNKLTSEQEGRARGLRRILKSDFDLRRGSFRPAYQTWLCPSDPTVQTLRAAKIPSDPVELALTKYELDSKLRIFPPSDETDRTAVWRFLLDGRGIDTSAWTLAFNPREDFLPFESIAKELSALDPKDVQLKEKSCEKLKQSSLKAFEKASQKSGK